MKVSKLSGAVLALVLSSQAADASGCLPRDKLVATLTDKYSESLTGRGLKGDTNLFEIFRASDGQTWTILQTFPNGMSCVIAAGEHWIDRAPEPVKKGVKG